MRSRSGSGSDLVSTPAPVPCALLVSSKSAPGGETLDVLSSPGYIQQQRHPEQHPPRLLFDDAAERDQILREYFHLPLQCGAKPVQHRLGREPPSNPLKETCSFTIVSLRQPRRQTAPADHTPRSPAFPADVRILLAVSATRVVNALRSETSEFFEQAKNRPAPCGQRKFLVNLGRFATTMIHP